MVNETTLLKSVSRLWITPAEYADKKGLTLRAAYWQMQNKKVRTIYFKGKWLIRDESVKLSDVISQKHIRPTKLTKS